MSTLLSGQRNPRDIMSGGYRARRNTGASNARYQPNSRPRQDLATIVETNESESPSDSSIDTVFNFTRPTTTTDAQNNPLVFRNFEDFAQQPSFIPVPGALPPLEFSMDLPITESRLMNPVPDALRQEVQRDRQTYANIFPQIRSKLVETNV